MTPRQQVRRLPDGRRLHLQDGPIDLVIEAFGPAAAVRDAYAAAAARFVTVLDELCAELPLLRRAAAPGASPLQGCVARRMDDAVAPFAAESFITPMAAVAGAVADEILAVMMGATAAPGATLTRAYVNNGGDIALHLAPEARFAVGLVDRPDRPALFGEAILTSADPVRGMATSGRHGRSFSLGIADAVTVLARNAAAADAAATILGNAVDLPGHPAVHRQPAATLQPDSDLGSRLVTRHVDPLTPHEIAAALDAGAVCGQALRRRGLIHAAALHLAGMTRVVGTLPGRLPPPAVVRERVHA